MNRDVRLRSIGLAAGVVIAAVVAAFATRELHQRYEDQYGFERNWVFLAFFALAPVTLATVAGVASRSMVVFVAVAVAAAVPMAWIAGDRAADPLRYDNSTALVRSVLWGGALSTLALGLFVPLVAALTQRWAAGSWAGRHTPV